RLRGRRRGPARDRRREARRRADRYRPSRDGRLRGRAAAASPDDRSPSSSDRHDRLRPGGRSPERSASGLRRPHRQTRERREDHARAVRNPRGVMNTFETGKNGNGNGNGNGHKTKGGGNGTVKAGAEQLHHRELLAALRQFKRGNFDVKMREDLSGLDGQICETFNEMVAMVKSIRDEAQEVSGAVGKEGQAQKRMRRMATTGGWNDYITAVNEVIEDLSG